MCVLNAFDHKPAQNRAKAVATLAQTHATRGTERVRRGEREQQELNAKYLQSVILSADRVINNTKSADKESQHLKWSCVSSCARVGSLGGAADVTGRG